LIGTTLFTGVPTSYALLDSTTVGVRCEIPATAGPFTFGEIGLYLAGNVLFARASFGSPQQKLTGTISGIPNVWRITAALKFSQAPALFSILTQSQNQLLEVADFSLLSSPGTMLGSPNAVIVHETSPYGEDPVLWKTTSGRWSVGKYTLFTSGTVTASTTTSVTAVAFSALSGALPGQYLIEFDNGDIRAVSSMAGTTANLSQPMVAASVASNVRVLKADAPSFTAPVLSDIEYNTLVTLFNTAWSTPSGATPATAKGWGQIAVSTVASGVVPTWTPLITAVSLACDLLDIPNTIAMASMQSDWSVGLSSQSALYTNLVQLIRQIAGSKTSSTPVSTLVPQLENSATHSGVYTQIHRDVSCTFASVAAAKAFFNSGGYVGFKVNITEDNMSQAIQKWRLAELGTIRFGGDRTGSLGNMKLENVDGDGTVAAAGNCGYYGLAAFRKKVWTHMIPVGAQPGTSQTLGFILFEVYCQQMTTTQFNLEFWITDNLGAAYSSATNAPPCLAVIETYTAAANTAALNTPAITRPVIAVLGTSTW
jgi:hypothetical protein